MVSESFKNVTRILTEKQMTPIIGTLNKQLLGGLVFMAALFDIIKSLYALRIFLTLYVKSEQIQKTICIQH